MKINKIVVMICSFSMMIHAIGFAKYQTIPLQQGYRQIDLSGVESISFDYKVFDKNDCKKYLGSKRIIKKGYQPVQVIFTNNTKHSIAISPANFSFRSAHSQDVARLLHNNGCVRGFCFGFGSLIFLPLIIPAITQGFGAARYNYAMDLDFANKEFKNQVVPPHTTVEGIVFAACDDFHDYFTISSSDIYHKNSFMISSKSRKIVLHSAENVEQLKNQQSLSSAKRVVGADMKMGTDFMKNEEPRPFHIVKN